MTDEMIRTPSGQMPAYVATPAAAAPWPGVVVVHDFGGMSQDLRHQEDWLANGPQRRTPARASAHRARRRP